MQVEKRWVISCGNQFVGIDSASGGYFYYTDFWGCHKFSTLEEMERYSAVNWGSLKDSAHKWEFYEVDEVIARSISPNPRFEE